MLAMKYNKKQKVY